MTAADTASTNTHEMIARDYLAKLLEWHEAGGRKTTSAARSAIS